MILLGWIVKFKQFLFDLLQGYGVLYMLVSTMAWTWIFLSAYSNYDFMAEVYVNLLGEAQIEMFGVVIGFVCAVFFLVVNRKAYKQNNNPQ